MNIEIQYILNSNPLLKKFLRENSFYYKIIIRNPNKIKEIIELMKKEYKLTFPYKLEKIQNDLSMINTIMDIIK